MRRTTALHRYPTTALLAVLALLAALLALPTPPTARAADGDTPLPTSVTVAGDFQAAIGCDDNWQADCALTHLARVGDSSRFSAKILLPPGSYKIKAALNDGWDENYGAGGVAGGPDIPISHSQSGEFEFTYDHTTHRLTFASPGTLPGSKVNALDKRFVRPSLRAGLTKERYYFVMADRFANGSAANDAGGLTGGRLETGLDPTAKGFYHGGDLKGLTGELDYIKGLGTTAIWLTPSFKNKPVQGTGDDVSAGYHGYWITDFTQVDPHLGTNADLKHLVDAAHGKGMKVFFDIITNHTADVIDNEQQKYSYVDKATSPYRDADGVAFDDSAYELNTVFPPLNKQSFPYTPVFRTKADETVKVPAWLNDPLLYHNRGDSTFAGESTTYGDFSGLDDLFTEQPKVRDGMTDVYKQWVDFGIDGFRIDTVKHVNMGFWQRFSPAMLAEAKKIGNDDFFMFGEVYDARPSAMSPYTTEGTLPATLDFGFQDAAKQFAQGKATTVLRDLFAGDDYYTDADSNAYELPTFTGNHDMGRLPAMLRDGGVPAAELLPRDRLANQLMYLVRGQPVVYYGDEQGLVGESGGDQNARQDMFATKTQVYADQSDLLGRTGSIDRFDPTSSLYRDIARMARLRQANPALADGTQVHRYASSGAGVFAVSRIDRDRDVEYLVAANNSTTAKTVDVATYSRKGRFTPLFGTSTTLRTDRESRTSITVPPLSVAVWKGAKRIDRPTSATVAYPSSPQPGATLSGRQEVGVSVPANTPVEVSFGWREAGQADWHLLGTDDAAPYRVFHDVSKLPKGQLIEYRAVVTNGAGKQYGTSTYGVVGDAATGGGDDGGGGVGPVTQPSAVSVAGDHNSEMGCASDWDPACDQAQLTLDPKDGIWKGTSDLPAGENHAYKAAIAKTWDENYGDGAVSNGSNISYTVPGSGKVSFYYDHGTHWVTSDAQGPIVTAPGSFQSELGCPADWSPDCMRPWLQDPDGDGTWTWRTDAIPAGSYETKVAHGLTWDESYGAGGAADGGNIPFTVPEGAVTTFSYVLATHVLTVSTSKPGAAPDLTKARAHWVDRRTIAWPADGLPSGTRPEQVSWRLHWSPTGGLAVDDEAVTGGSSAKLTYDPDGLPASVTKKYPQLKGFLSLRLSAKTARQAETILRGQVAVAQYDDLGRLLDATGVQVPGVLDSLYAKAARKQALGITWSGGRPTFRVWAPTAKSVHLKVWPTTGAAQRVSMQRDAAGSWSVRGPRSWANAQYLYDLQVFAPTTLKVERNQVTDPYSVALTTDSRRSVAVDLDARSTQPSLWRNTPSPKLARAVDSTIYELHVRDFSISDTTVPKAHRGTYLAFADRGAGTKHLQTLAEAGLNTVHLLPTFDITSVPERRSQQQTPDCDLASLPPASDQQQACVTAVAAQDGYNWGYDPYHWMAPEGSYATNPVGAARVAQFRTMVGALHRDGLRVVLDQVYNHTSASGQAATSVLDRVVPGYYQRLNPKTGAVETSTCCQNIATEHAMAERAMVDSVVLWAKQYRVDGFRFDLMGHSSKANVLAVRTALDRLTLRRDGVDGRSIYLYGEGWNFGEVADDAQFEQARQGNLGGTGIGTFSDRLRDAVRGGGPFDDDPRAQGLGSGLAGSPNGAEINGDAAKQAQTLAHDTDLVELGMAGNLRDFVFRTNASGEEVRGDEVDYNGQPAGYADEPDEVVSYVDAHDNETIWDALTLKLPTSTPMADRIRMNTLSLATTALGQSPSFWHAGADLLRSKSLDRNSFDSGDWFNRLDWTGADNGFGHGLPPKADNEAKWDFQRPLLENAALKPTAAEVATASAQAQDLLRLRASTRLLRLGSAELIQQKVSFPASGSTQKAGLIVMRVDDTVGRDVDPRLQGALVVLNATPDRQTQQVNGLLGHHLTLSPVQARGADPVARTTTWTDATGTVSVPARTAVVLVER